MRTAYKFALISLMALSACSAELQHGLTEEEANQILVALHQNGIDSHKEREEGAQSGAATWKIVASKGDQHRAWELLSAAELPKPRVLGLEMFNRGSLIPTPTEEKSMLLLALAGELSKTIRLIDGVVDARVHVVLPEEDRFRERDRPAPEPTAAVYLKWKPRSSKNVTPPFRVEDIQELVSHGIPNLKSSAVSVMVSSTPLPEEAQGSDVKMSQVLGMKMSPGARWLLIILALALLSVAGFLIYTLVAKVNSPAAVE